MLTTIALSLVLSCKRAPPPPPVEPEPVVIVRCEGGDQVRRDLNGRELDRFASTRCMPRPQPRPQPQPQQDVLKFGLSFR